MIIPKKLYLSTILVFLLLLPSCTTTKLKSVWKDASYDGYIHNIMVVGMAGRNSVRKFFEREFVKQFKEYGTKAVASVDLIPSLEDLNEDVILAQAMQHGIDMIMTTHIMGLDEKSSYHPPRNFHTYYSMTHAYVHAKEHSSQTVSLASNIYETKTENLIWSVTSKTVDTKQSTYEIVKSVSKVMIKNLRKNGLIR